MGALASGSWSCRNVSVPLKGSTETHFTHPDRIFKSLSAVVYEDVSFAVCRIEHLAHNNGWSGLWIVWPPIHNTSHCRSFCELLGSSESDLNSKSMHTIIISSNYLMFALRLIEFFMIHFLSLSLSPSLCVKGAVSLRSTTMQHACRERPCS